MEFKTDNSPFTGSTSNIGSVMRQVLYALIPGVLVMFYFYGWGVLINIVLAILIALGFEILSLWLRKRPIKPFLADYSAIVTACLFALSIPPLAPWWILMVGLFFAIVIAKHLYGGLGYNPFNPAMVGFAVLIVSFPLEMTQWISPEFSNDFMPSLADSLRIVFTGFESLYSIDQWDAITMATPLDDMKIELKSGHYFSEVMQTNGYGFASGKAWELVSLAYLGGGLWLLYKGIINWRIPVSLLLTLAVVAAIFGWLEPDMRQSPLFHLFSGATLLGAFFIATDPVSASTTPRGQLFYGASIGFFIYVIRTWGNYPDAIAFSVLIMNMSVPMIDYFTQPRVFGAKSGGK
ncbi:MAG TPA: electron transport complex subunit RsxD [Leucothrix mucor]|uniref:Ion-translocating oxidoreductase complex subunit D n=1 Tax=Leucothrix mucor TaxID=45248 RepID=A0A7V2SY49_LEUMU|nr:electron transport complex subunit RsxD [Leucothrix mucor]